MVPSVQIQLGPSRSNRISFWVQLLLAIFWLLYGSILLFTDNPTNDQNYFHYLFLILAVGYLLYLLAEYTSLFGIQAYLQITPEYIVHKWGLFRSKLPIAFAQINTLHIASRGLHITLQDGTNHYLDLAQIKKHTDLHLIKQEIRQAASIHGFALTQGPSSFR